MNETSCASDWCDCDRDAVTGILSDHGNRIDALIMILQDVQRRYRYLPEAALLFVAERLAIPFSQVYEVATFYRSFSLEPRGAHEIKVCLGTACHLRGGELLLRNLERELEVKAGGTTGDGAFTLETVNCVGACALAPLVVVDGDYHGNMRSSQVKEIVDGYREK